MCVYTGQRLCQIKYANDSLPKSLWQIIFSSVYTRMTETHQLLPEQIHLSVYIVIFVNIFTAKSSLLQIKQICSWELSFTQLSLNKSPKDRSPESNMHRRSNMVFSVIKAGHSKVNSPNDQILNACEILCLLKSM